MRQAQPEPDETGAPVVAPPRMVTAQPVDGEEIAILLKRGSDYLQSGDLIAARIVLRRAADAGNGEAALALGSTFDPIVFGQLGVLGFAPDAAQARSWYERASELGSPEGARRIEQLKRVTQ